MNKYSAIFVSDIHLSAKPPRLRSDEPDWYEAMARPIRELRRLSEKLNVPVICAGDVFDHWNPPAELISFAIQELPKMYAVPGQHDLYHHSYENIERSGYWTLVEAGIISHIEPGAPVRVGDLRLFGFPWGFPIEPCQWDSKIINEKNEIEIDPDITRIAVMHRYLYLNKKTCYQTASEEDQLCNLSSVLQTYDAVVAADNHIGWTSTLNNITPVCNTGGFMRRHSPDMDRHPFLGVLTKEGQIKKHLLDTGPDVYTLIESDNVQETGFIELGDFTDSLLGLRNSEDLDFGQVIRRYCKKHRVDGHVTQLITKALGD